MASKTLKSSAEKVGCLYPILLDNNGEIIDGEHRFQVNNKWRKVKLTHVTTEKDRLLVRIVANNVRRRVPSDEKNKLLNRLGQVLMNEGIKPGEIANSIAEETGMSYRWVAKYLSNQFKDKLQSGRAKSAACCAAEILDEVLAAPKRGEQAQVKSYTNTTFVMVTLNKEFYAEFQETSLRLGVPPEISILKALEQYYEKMNRAIQARNSMQIAQ